MATPQDLLQGLRTALIGVTSLPATQVFIDISSEGTVSAIARGDISPPVVVSIFDMKSPKNTTRWMGMRSPAQTVSTQVTITASKGLIDPGTMQTLTLAGNPTPIANDAVGLNVFVNNQIYAAAAIIDMTQPDPLADLTSKLAAAINANASLTPLLTASALGDVITLNNISEVGLRIVAKSGNIATLARAPMNSRRPIMISVWSQTEALRGTYGNMIMDWIANSQENFGIQLTDGSWCRVLYNTDQMTKDTHLPDVYRWLFIADCEISTVLIDTLYSVLGIVEQESTN